MKPVLWVGSSKEDLKEFPEEVQDSVGFALHGAQYGLTPDCAKPFKITKGGGAGVMEIVENFDGDTYRAVYTVKFGEFVYVLHCFQKKSKSGIKTPQHDVDLIKARLKKAEEDYRQRKAR